jgi:CPA2 family monovalent cation:H+ antiporter-2
MELGGVIEDLLWVLLAGACAGVVCRWRQASLLVGYLVVGALIGAGGLGIVEEPRHELEMIAEAGALMLLFSVGIEFSFAELSALRTYFFVGGALQMALVALPLTLAARLAGMPPTSAVLAGVAGSLSSTVLVFRALTEQGQTESPHGRRGLAVLLFQDAALVPLLMLTPLLTGGENGPQLGAFAALAVKAVAFFAGLWALQRAIAAILAPTLAGLRSVELVVLVVVMLLGSLCWTAYRLGLPPAVGAFGAGLALSGNRLTRQIDAIVLPFRETFAAVFFVTLGMLLRPAAFLAEPLLLAIGLAAMVLLKACAAAVALRAVGLPWRGAWGMGAGLAQLGEFSFLLVAQGMNAGLISAHDYNRMLFIAVATLVLTPWLLNRGLAWAGGAPTEALGRRPTPPAEGQRALVVGIGPIGGQAASRLETLGIDVALIDLNAVNLHPFAQLGFATFAGDASDPVVLERADVADRHLAVVCVPKDDLALEIVRALRKANPRLEIIVRCRYQGFAARLRKAGAASVVSEEQEAAGPLMRRCEQWLRQTAG